MGRNRKAWAVALVAAIVTIALAGLAVRLRSERSSLGDCPTLGEDFTPTRLMACANRLIAAGEEQAYRTLRSEAPRGARSSRLREMRAERVILLCRVLYRPRPSELLRGPYWGAPNIPYDSMPASDWPDLPLVLCDDIPFLITTSYLCLGPPPEESCAYLEHCRSNGVFRIPRYPIRSREDQEGALDALFSSERWRRVQWPGKTDARHEPQEDSIKKRLRAQCR